MPTIANNFLSFVSGQATYSMEYDPKIVKIDIIYDIEDDDLWDHRIIVKGGASQEHREPKMGWPMYQYLLNWGYTEKEITEFYNNKPLWTVFEIMES